MLDSIFDDMPLAEAVRVEALANGYRRETARQTGATVRGLRGPQAPAFSVGERIRQLAEELDREERRRRIATPSALIQTMKRDWPDQSAAVKAYAEANGLALGEAWARLIGAAVATIGKASE